MGLTYTVMDRFAESSSRQ